MVNDFLIKLLLKYDFNDCFIWQQLTIKMYEPIRALQKLMPFE